MAYRFQKNPQSEAPEIIVDGWENGIGTSPHKGLGMLKGVNTSTQMNEVMSSFIRTQQSQLAGSGAFTQVDASTVSVSGITLLAGSWVHITGSGTTGLSGDYYYVGGGKLSTAFVQNVGTTGTVKAIVVGGGGGGGVSGGGGGGGSVTTSSAFAVTNQAYSVVVGAGGTASGAGGNDGVDSTFSTLTGAGGKLGVGGGGSGGASGSHTGGAGDGTNTGGGGAGDSANGSARIGTTGGVGGGGTDCSAIIPTASTYGGGGGGGSADGSGGGVGGGGGGVGGGTGVAGTAGTANTGGGGGGGGGGAGIPAGGGSGVVVIAYLTSSGISATGGTITTSGGYTIHTFTTSGTWTFVNKLVNNISSGSATFSVYPMGKPIESAYERYNDSSANVQYRYYILDDLAQVWTHDTATLVGVTTPTWFTPELPYTLSGRTASGLGVLNGWLTISLNNSVNWKPTSVLGAVFQSISNIQLSTYKGHNTLSGHQGKIYWCDGNFIASLFPNSSQISGASNLQSYASYTASTVTGTISALIGGAYPNSHNLGTRVPAIFYTFGTLPTALTTDFAFTGGVMTSIVFYIDWLSSGSTFKVYAAASGGSALDIQTGSTDTQYFNTFNPLAVDSTAITNYVFTPQRLNLPFFETAQCMAEIGNNIVIGGATNTLYPWDQVNSLPGDVIPLPENNVANLITVNNYAYVFAGQKGNIYVTNGSSVSLAITVPDYCAGIAGTPSSYIEPYFTWGGAAYVRGRVYFSILDQTSVKTGNCGGVWSFIPTQNFYIGQDIGLSLRLENQNSYATYNGVATVILSSQNQSAIGPQYWTGWYSSISAPTYGIDYTGTIPTTTSVIDTDLIPTGTMLNKMTFNQIEYKLVAPLVSGDTIALSYRQNGTDSFASCGTILAESVTALSGYLPINFSMGQWLQLRITFTPLATSGSSFIRLKEIAIR